MVRSRNKRRLNSIQVELRTPKIISKKLNIALLPRFYPQITQINNGIYERKYKSKNIDLSVNFRLDMGLLENYTLSNHELELIDTRYLSSISDWLMDKRSKQKNSQIEINIREMTEDLFLGKKVRTSDCEKVEANLNILYMSEFTVNFEKLKGSFRIIKFLDPNKSGAYTCFMADDVEVIYQKDMKDPKNHYISKRIDYIYPKMGRHEYNLRKYLSTIQHDPKIPRIRKSLILEYSGYNSDVNMGIAPYRKEDEEYIMNEFKEIAEEYGYRVEQIESNKYSIHSTDDYYRLNPFKVSS